MKKLVLVLATLLGLGFCGWVVGYSYLLNSSFFFYDGWVGLFTLLWVIKLKWRTSVILNVTANTLILLIVLLPMADAVFAFHLNRTQKRLRPPVAAERIYAYEVAKGNPAQFVVWWGRMLEELTRLSRQIATQDPLQELPFMLKPGSVGTFFDSEIRVNRLGFRDREFDVEKKDQYRIVAIGESTTMGLTLTKKDRPWPVVLEEKIRTELKVSRPVEVINAGVLSYNLQDSLARLRRDVLPLKPDMIISYHGYNGFHFLDDTLGAAERTAIEATPPRFIERPSILLAHFEYRIKLLQFRRKYFSPTPLAESLARRKASVLDSYYAKLYGELISFTRTNGIKLVLLSHNLAVNDRSPLDVIRFYEGGFPDVGYRIQANRLQTYLLEEMAKRNCEVIYIDTSPGLDGCFDNFIDLVHLTQKGRNQLAENVWGGIRGVLELESPLLPR